RWKPIVADCMCAFEIALRGVFILFIDHAPFLPQSSHEITPNLRLGTRTAPQLRYIGQKLRIVSDRRIRNLESPVSRSERNCDFASCAVLLDYFATPHHCVERCETLLTVNYQRRCSEGGSCRGESAGISVIGRVPKHKRPNRKAYKERIEKGPDFCIFPNERPLQVRQGDHTTLDVVHQGGNGALPGLVDWGSPANLWLARSPRIILIRL